MRGLVVLWALLLMGCQVTSAPDAPQGEVQNERVVGLYFLRPVLGISEATDPGTAGVLNRAVSSADTSADTAVLQVRDSSAGEGTLFPESVGVWEGGSFRMWVAFYVDPPGTGTCTISLRDSSGYPIADATATIDGTFGVTDLIETVDDLEMLDRRTITARLESCDLAEGYTYRIGSRRTATIAVYERITDISELIAIGQVSEVANLAAWTHDHETVGARWVGFYADSYTVRFQGQIVEFQEEIGQDWTISVPFSLGAEARVFTDRRTGLRPNTRYCYEVTAHPFPNHDIQGAPTEDVTGTACARTLRYADPEASNACSRFAQVVRLQGHTRYSGHCHNRDWEYWTTSATSIGQRGSIGVEATLSYVIVCGHNGSSVKLGATDVYCTEGQDHEWVGFDLTNDGNAPNRFDPAQLSGHQGHSPTSGR